MNTFPDCLPLSGQQSTNVCKCTGGSFLPSIPFSRFRMLVQLFRLHCFYVWLIGLSLCSGTPVKRLGKFNFVSGRVEIMPLPRSFSLSLSRTARKKAASSTRTAFLIPRDRDQIPRGRRENKRSRLIEQSTVGTTFQCRNLEF